MNLNLDTSIVDKYHGQSQIIRIITESWVKLNSFCPNCGNSVLNSFENNRPVADFYCFSCKQEYELKSKNGNLGDKIVDGAYESMISRIESENNPNFFFLIYDKNKWVVSDFLIIPNYYFVSDIIEKRKPLSLAARRAGWTGCNILLNRIPANGRIFLIKNSLIAEKERVISQWKQTEFLKNFNLKSRGWLIDILVCIEAIPKKQFSLDEVYKFEDKLKLRHPNNNFIRDKIRQQLQVLRDKGVIDFVSRGVYRKK